MSVLFKNMTQCQGEDLKFKVRERVRPLTFKLISFSETSLVSSLNNRNRCSGNEISLTRDDMNTRTRFEKSYT